MDNVKIIIIGAGIGGLVLANGLKKEGIQYRLYEKATKVKDNYILSITQDSYNPLKEILSDLVFESLSKALDPGKTTFYQLDDKLNELLFLKQDETSTVKFYYFERQFLINALSQEINIEYEKELIKVEEKDNKVNIEFHDGTKETCDILIAADGSKSRIREILYPNKLTKMNYSSITGHTDLSFLGDDPLSQKLLSGYVFIYGDVCYAIFDICRFINKDYYIFWTFSDKAELIDSCQNSEEVMDFIKEKTKDWDPSIQKLLYNSGTSSLRINSFKHVDLSLRDDLMESSKKILFLGDSAHATIPVKGTGALSAIQDAHDLIECFKIFKKNQNFEEFKNYNSKIISRGFDRICESIKINDFNHVEGWWAQSARNVTLKGISYAMSFTK